MLCYILIKQKKAAIITEGNLHVTYNLIKNPLFAGFGVMQEISSYLPNRRKMENPQTYFVCGFFNVKDCDILIPNSEKMEK